MLGEGDLTCVKFDSRRGQIIIWLDGLLIELHPNRQEMVFCKFQVQVTLIPWAVLMKAPAASWVQQGWKKVHIVLSCFKLREKKSLPCPVYEICYFLHMNSY